MFELTEEIKLPDETSKDKDPVNVNPAEGEKPTEGNPTTTAPSPTEPSKNNDSPKGDENVQQAIQKHAELREKAEKDAQEAKEKAEAAQKEAAEARQRLQEVEKQNVENAIKSRVEHSNLPKPIKERIMKDPVNGLSAFDSTAPKDATNVTEVSRFVSERLDDVVGNLETEFGAIKSPKNTFVDSDNASITNPGKTISQADLKKMSPYEIQEAMRRNPALGEQLHNAGGKAEF